MKVTQYAPPPCLLFFLPQICTGDTAYCSSHRRTEELFSCLQKLVVASMTIGLIGLGVAFIFLIEYIAGW